MFRRLSKFLKVFTFFFFLIAGFRQDKSQSHLYICKYVPISFSSRLQLIVLDSFQLLRTLLHSNIFISEFCVFHYSRILSQKVAHLPQILLVP